MTVNTGQESPGNQFGKRSTGPKLAQPFPVFPAKSGNGATIIWTPRYVVSNGHCFLLFPSNRNQCCTQLFPTAPASRDAGGKRYGNNKRNHKER